MHDVTNFSDEFHICNDNEIIGNEIKDESCFLRIEDNNAIYSLILNMSIEIDN